MLRERVPATNLTLWLQVPWSVLRRYIVQRWVRTCGLRRWCYAQSLTESRLAWNDGFPGVSTWQLFIRWCVCSARSAKHMYAASIWRGNVCGSDSWKKSPAQCLGEMHSLFQSCGFYQNEKLHLLLNFTNFFWRKLLFRLTWKWSSHLNCFIHNYIRCSSRRFLTKWSWRVAPSLNMRYTEMLTMPCSWFKETDPCQPKRKCTWPIRHGVFITWQQRLHLLQVRFR